MCIRDRDIGETPLQDDLQKLEPTLSPDELSMDIPDELMNGETEPSPSEQIEFKEPRTKLWVFLVAGSVFQMCIRDRIYIIKRHLFAIFESSHYHSSYPKK